MPLACRWAAAAIVAAAHLLIVPTCSGEPSKLAAPVVPGLTRIPGKSAAELVQKGRLLLGELNCTRCHASGAALDAHLVPKSAPILDTVGSRIRPSYLRKLLADPHAAKPGTTMPDVLAGMPAPEKQKSVEALVHFLASTGTLRQERPDRRLIGEGRKLYNQVGCVACHGSRDAAGNPDKVLPTSVPLGDLGSKYSVASLRLFLENPLQASPSGRMPGLLNGPEAQRVANYLMQGANVAALAPNMTYAYYEGNWDNLPDFDKLKPVATGKASDFDLTVARRANDMALRFTGYLRIDKDGEYRFYLTSDDGSKLWIDGQLAVANDGIHPPTTVGGNVRLSKGMHELVVGVFNAGGGVELGIDIEGRGMQRQAVSPLVYLTKDGEAKKPTDKGGKDEDALRIEPELVARGRGLFAALGCASCHSLTKDGKIVEPMLAAPPLAKLHAEAGCLSEKPMSSVPWYALAAEQRAALIAALMEAAPKNDPSPKDIINRTLAAFNCYACHDRDKVGGIEEPLNSFFVTTQPEMGDEGRIPPTLDGVGGKLTAAYLRHVLDQGPKDRPYMLSRMPRFGDANVGKLVGAFAAVDTVEPVAKIAFSQPLSRVKADARHLVGGNAFACIKCHTFAGHRAEGIQAMEMTKMPQRLRRDWYHRYMLNPQAIRVGTRMPAAWPDGKTFYPDLLDGDTAKQIEAIWVYLSEGSRAQLPVGLNKNAIPLVPDKEAIVYRGFIQGAGPRGIAVGYPEKAHLAFDPNLLSITTIWQGAFIDAARHWTDRGDGFEGPLGDNVLHLPNAVSFARLAKDDEPWPTKNARELGYRFRGYRLSSDQRPTFQYEVDNVRIEDFPEAVAAKPNAMPTLRRTLTLTATKSVARFYFRAAVADKIEPLADSWYEINGEWKLRLESASKPAIRKNSGKTELLMPVHFKDGKAKIVEEFAW
jgi:mono/diheme cytochrome c family protein